MAEIRDPIHGFIELSDKEKRVINSNVFQRLRRIRQLAYANLVYPGATHTRFSHSIGTMHIAGLMADRLYRLSGKDDQKVKQKVELLRLAALLHDIGHGPFSHVSEYVLDKFYERSENNGEDIEEIHEKISQDIIEKDTELQRILGSDYLNQITGILRPSNSRSLDHEIVSGPLDADKMDYLLRDSYFAGVKYGVFDIERLLQVLVPIPDGQEEYLGIAEEGLETVEQYLLAKYFITQQVYRHKVRIITDFMVTEGIKNLVNNPQDPDSKKLAKAYRYRSSKSYLETYLRIDDHVVCHTMLNGKNSLARKFFDRLHKRNLVKEILRLPIKDTNWLIKPEKNEQIRKGEIGDLRKVIAKELSINHNFIYIGIMSLRNPIFKEPSFTLEPSEIVVKRQSGPPVKIERLSVLFNSLADKAEKDYVILCADDADKTIRGKTNKRKKIEGLIKEFLES